MADGQLPLGWQPDGTYFADTWQGTKLIRTMNDQRFKVNLDDGTFHEDDLLFLYVPSGLLLKPQNEGALLWLQMNAD